MLISPDQFIFISGAVKFSSWIVLDWDIITGRMLYLAKVALLWSKKLTVWVLREELESLVEIDVQTFLHYFFFISCLNSFKND